ncbi:outer membrane protein [Collimonas pratensis]|uniref:Surface antigen family protein n=1 Tax=Collimonas pratensis TaxID=279113 RepID=A0A127QC06_9BURK|nr:P44/Msp2 family outer membrane protein [Collimonas pratensis]AMP07570.1 surface antigen family protein [Collimonas pratensis]
MKSTWKSLATTLTLLAAGTSLPALAEPVSGLYVAGGFGYNDLHTETISSIGASFGVQPGGNTKTDGGTAVLASIGWGFSNGIRAELEGGFRRNSFNHVTAGALHDANASGHEDKSSVFANVLYDFGKTSFGISPYVGIGAGHVKSKWNSLVVTNATETVAFDDSVSKRAYQGILGVSFLENVAPGLSMTLEYRYLSLDGGSTHSGRVERSRFGAFPVTAQLENTRDQSLLIGLRYQFDGPKK